MTPPNIHRPAGTNVLGDTLVDSKKQFRKSIASIDRLLELGRDEDARAMMPKLEAMGREMHRLLNPRDPVDKKTLDGVDRELTRLRKTTAKGWSGAVGKGLLALVVGGSLGVVALVGALWLFLL